MVGTDGGQDRLVQCHTNKFSQRWCCDAKLRGSKKSRKKKQNQKSLEYRKVEELRNSPAKYSVIRSYATTLLSVKWHVFCWYAMC